MTKSYVWVEYSRHDSVYLLPKRRRFDIPLVVPFGDCGTEEEVVPETPREYSRGDCPSLIP